MPRESHEDSGEEAGNIGVVRKMVRVKWEEEIIPAQGFAKLRLRASSLTDQVGKSNENCESMRTLLRLYVRRERGGSS